MLEKLRSWRQKVRRTNGQSTVERTRRSADDARERRAQSVTALQEDIHRIQHEISTLHDRMTGEAGVPTEARQATMAELHRALAEKQQELAKYQARI